MTNSSASKTKAWLIGGLASLASVILGGFVGYFVATYQDHHNRVSTLRLNQFIAADSGREKTNQALRSFTWKLHKQKVWDEKDLRATISALADQHDQIDRFKIYLKPDERVPVDKYLGSLSKVRATLVGMQPPRVDASEFIIALKEMYGVQEEVVPILSSAGTRYSNWVERPK